MKGLKVLVYKRNPEWDEEFKNFKNDLERRRETYGIMTERDVKRLLEDFKRTHSQYIKQEAIIRFNDISKAVVELLSDHSLHVVNIESLEVVQEQKEL